MEWRQILGFYHLVKEGSFTKAANATLRTQPALSQQIKALEEELGCRLVERLGRGKLRLTPAGERFLEFARTVIREHSDLEESLNEIVGEAKGSLAVAAPFTTLYYLFPGILKRYTRQFPHVRLTVLDRPQSQVVELVRSGGVDFGVALEQVAPGDLESIPWKEVASVLMTPKNHPLAGRNDLTIEDIAHFPLILPPATPAHTGRVALESLLAQRGLKYHVIMESSNVDLSSVYVEAGLGVALATVVVDLDILEGRNLVFVALEGYFEPARLAVIMRRGLEPLSYRRAFLDGLGLTWPQVASLPT